MHFEPDAVADKDAELFEAVGMVRPRVRSFIAYFALYVVCKDCILLRSVLNELLSSIHQDFPECINAS